MNPYITFNTNIIANMGAHLPHWQQSGKLVFITCHLGDSLPQSVLEEIRKEKQQWLEKHPEPLSSKDKAEYAQLFTEKTEQYLDAGYGSCIFQEDYCANILKESLNFYDGVKYHLVSYVIMPNHLHVLLYLIDVSRYSLSGIMKGIKGNTTYQINKHLGTTGSIWHQDFYDRMIRNKQHLDNTLNYIKKNADAAQTDYYFFRETPIPEN